MASLIAAPSFLAIDIDSIFPSTQTGQLVGKLFVSTTLVMHEARHKHDRYIINQDVVFLLSHNDINIESMYLSRHSVHHIL